VETTGGLMSVLISRNTIVPVKKSRLYYTTDDNQTSVTIKVFEGERAATLDNRLLGSFELSNIKPAPRGSAKIRVTFELDADGIFTVSAVDESEIVLDKKEVVITIQNNNGRLSKDDLQRFIQDAESHAARDEIFTKFIRLRTDFENLLYGVRRTFTETAADILAEHADPETVKCVLDVVTEQFVWLESLTNTTGTEEIVDEIQRRRDWVENDVARSVVDAVNKTIRDATAI